MTDEKKAEAVKQLTEDLERAVDPGAKPQSEYEGIAVLGSHPQTVLQAPLHDPKWRIYACSPHNIEQRTLPRVNEWFECHAPITHPTRQYEYLRRLEDNNVAQNPVNAEVVWVRDPQALARWKDARPYPEADMDKVWGPFWKTSSIAFMLAKAIVDCKMMNIPKLGIWGVMQASETEYAYQRPTIQQLIWEANKMEIEVMVPRESGLLEPPRENW